MSSHPESRCPEPVREKRCRILSQEDVDRVLGLADLPLQIRDLRIRRIEHLPGLEHVERRAHAVLEAQFGELDRILLGLHRVFCDLKLQVEVAKQKVIARHIAHQRQDYGLLCVLGAQQLSPGCFGRASIAPEQVHLKDNVCRKRKNVGLDVLIGLSAAESRIE